LTSSCGCSTCSPPRAARKAPGLPRPPASSTPRAPAICGPTGTLWTATSPPGRRPLTAACSPRRTHRPRGSSPCCRSSRLTAHYRPGRARRPGVTRKPRSPPVGGPSSVHPADGQTALPVAEVCLDTTAGRHSTRHFLVRSEATSLSVLFGHFLRFFRFVSKSVRCWSEVVTRVLSDFPSRCYSPRPHKVR
jgi:hypothetical protein